MCLRIHFLGNLTQDTRHCVTQHRKIEDFLPYLVVCVCACHLSQMEVHMAPCVWLLLLQSSRIFSIAYLRPHLENVTITGGPHP